ncbi:hypothetical protein ABZ079_23815 [Streptomyces sp. NPDC006314]|uniref:hypothetical protein n=1 Tax=Streptomyces sp. NPDC006314 TaxID=3154475 RepID=UPI0033B28841
MAKRKVHRRARKILGEEPVALVWCGLPGDVPAPPKEAHRAAGRDRLKPGRHWLYYAGLTLAGAVVIPWFLADQLLKGIDRLPWKQVRQEQARARSGRAVGTRGTGGDRPSARKPSDNVFDGDWTLTAGQLLLRWYTQSPNSRRLLLLTRERICLAASPKRRLSPTNADDFDIVTEFTRGEARLHREPDRRHFSLCFADGSWLHLGRPAEAEDAERFLDAISA